MARGSLHSPNEVATRGFPKDGLWFVIKSGGSKYALLTISGTMERGFQSRAVARAGHVPERTSRRAVRETRRGSEFFSALTAEF